MKHKTLLSRASIPATLSIAHGPTLHVVAAGDWVISEVAQLDEQLAKLRAATAHTATIDARQITHLDTAGSWLLLRTQRALEAEGLPRPELLVPPHYADLLAKVSDGLEFRTPAPGRKGPWLYIVLDRIGRETLRILAQGYQIVGFLGQISLETTEAILQPQRVLPWPALATQIEDCGLTALPILGLLAFLLGIVIAYQGAGQLKRFGAEIYTVNLLGVAVLREIGGLIAAIIVPSDRGRSPVRSLGNKYRPRPVSGLNSSMTAMACVASGTICATRAFIFPSGMRHSAAFVSISDHSARRSSPGRTNNSGASCNAHLVTRVPW